MDLCILSKQSQNNEDVIVKLRAKGTKAVGESTKQVLNVKMTFKLTARLFTSNAVANPNNIASTKNKSPANVINRK
jgi:hypothetical protein